MPLFEVVVMEVPTKQEVESNATAVLEVEEKLVFGPAWVIAKDTQQAGFNVIMDNAEKLKGINKARMQVLIRPFA